MAQALIESTVLSEDQGFIKKIVTPLGSVVKKNQVLATIKRLDPIYKFQALNLLSPIDGVVSKVFVRQGTNVAKGDQVFMITNPEKSRLTIEVSAKEKGLLKKGDKGSFNWNKIKTPVKITGVSPIIDPATGTATIELVFANKPNNLPLGVLGQVHFSANERNGFLIKADAIVYVGTKTYVRVVEKKNGLKIIKKTPVTLGTSINQRVEVKDGLKPQDWVVIRSSGFLKEGVKVEVKNPPKEPTSETPKSPVSKVKQTDKKSKENK
jgi:RND family efflux transporter MFP subunit